jgi:hypothetical protein
MAPASRATGPRAIPIAPPQPPAIPLRPYMPSYASGTWLPLHFGLGTAAAARVTVRWPDGKKQDLGELPAGAYRLVKGEAPAPLRARGVSKAASR